MNNWLDKYEQGGMVLKQKTKDNYGKKANPNNPDVSLPPGFKGLAYNTKGRNYSPAWGGQFQDGGNLMPAMAGANQTMPMYQMGGNLFNTNKTAWVDSIHNARKGDLNFVQRMFDQRAGSIQIPGQRGTSTHFMESGDKRAYPTVVQMPNGKLQYLNQNDKDAAWNYAKRTKQFIQFPTDEQAEWYANDGYKKGTGVLEKKQMGGSIPGAVGFTYARTAGSAPSNGPYAKKTKASAQDGKKLKNIEGESENFLKGWMNSPMYKEMINNSINASQLPNVETLKAINREDQLNKVSWQFSDLDADKSWLDKLFSPTLGEFKLDKNKIFLNPNSNDKFYETAVHELSHATDLAGANIPRADVEKMWKYQKQHEQEKGKITKFFDDEDFNTYVGRPTETRARLNAIRYLGKKEGIYDPYTEKVNKDILKKLPSSIVKPTQLDQLRLIYSDDQIVDLLNSVSKNNSNKLISQAQNGQEMKYYQEGLDFKPKTISKNGGWLDKFDTAQGGGTFMDKLDANNPTLQKYLNIEKNRSDMASYFPEIRKAQEKPKNEKAIIKNEQKIKKQNLAKAVANAKDKQATVKQDNRTSREKEIAQQRVVDEYLNEARRTSPLAQTFGSFTPSGYNPGAGAIGAEAFVNMNPLITGPFLSGTRLYGQAKGDNPYGFGESTLGNIMGAVGLMGDVGFLKSAAPTGRIAGKNTYKNFVDQQSSKKLTSPSPEPNLEVLPRGNYLESDLVAGKKITMNDVDKIAKKEMDWLQSDEYFKRRSTATGESASEIQKDVDKIFENWKNISVEAGKTKKNVGGYYNSANDKIVIGNALESREEGLSVLDHEVKHAFSQLGGLKYRGGYKNYPTTDVGNWLTKVIDYTDTQYYAEPWEQQVRGLRLLDYINETQGIPRGTALTMENIDDFAKSVSPSSESGKGFWNKYGDVGQQLVKMKEADRQLKFIPSNIKQGKFPFKFQQKGELRKNILDWLNKTYAIPVGVGLGAGALGSDEEVPQKQDGGDIPIDPDGYWNPENWGNPVIIPSTDITMEGVGQPLVGISDTGDIQYMEPGEDYEFDGEYVTEYPVAKKGISVNNADAQPIKKLDQSLNFTNYNKPTKGGWLDKYN